MSGHDDEYLWSGEGSASENLAALERSLAPLRWRPQPLVLPSTEAEAGIVSLREVRERRASDRLESSWWPAIVAGLVAAAAVLALSLWPGQDSGTPEPARSIEPSAPPSSPDLKDPFGPREPPGFTAPITNVPNPQVAPTLSPDLKDPFAGRVDPPAPNPKPTPRSREDQSPDLKNPFADAPAQPAPAGELVDPFGTPPDSPPPGTSPDLEDPFSSR